VGLKGSTSAFRFPDAEIEALASAQTPDDRWRHEANEDQVEDQLPPTKPCFDAIAWYARDAVTASRTAM